MLASTDSPHVRNLTATTSRRMSFLLLIFFALSDGNVPSAAGLAPINIYSIQKTGDGSSSLPSPSTFPLFAKKVPGMKKSSPERNGGGGGFGSSLTSTQTTKSQSLQGKVRTISGFSGSGTKPLRQAANTFDAIRKEYGKEACWDLYVKSPLDDPHRLWFVGKIAVTPQTAATPQQAVLAQKRIILEYSKRELRPQNLGLPKYAETLELWLAPGDSEMECVQNKVSLEKVVGSIADLVDDFSVAQVGCNPEIYIGDERGMGGLRITRDENGDPIKAAFDVNESA